MKVEPCGWCGHRPIEWNWCPGGARVECECGVCGPTGECSGGKGGFHAAFRAWNAMWAGLRGGTGRKATRRLLEKLAAGIPAGPLEGEDREAVELIIAAVVENDLEELR